MTETINPFDNNNGNNSGGSNTQPVNPFGGNKARPVIQPMPHANKWQSKPIASEAYAPQPVAPPPQPINPPKHPVRNFLIVFISILILWAIIQIALIGFAQRRVCENGVDEYSQAKDSLQDLVDETEPLLDITTDDVLDEDKSIVNGFQTYYKQAQKALEQADVSQYSQWCNSLWFSNTQNSSTKISPSPTELQIIYNKLDHASKWVKLASDEKELSDAKSALSSTVLSAQALSRNSSLSASVRTQLNRAVSMATSILDSGDVDEIKEARDQLDDIIETVNSSILSINQELLDIEAAVSAIASQSDANGDYTSSGLSVLHAANLQEVWGLERMRGACSITAEQASSWLAAFCSGTPGYIYISTTLPATTTHDAYFADAMRHEVAHYLIYRRCGTPEPASIGDQANAESTASSYAVLYLGANPNILNRAADSRYHMNQASDDAAARIHAGQCY